MSSNIYEYPNFAMTVRYSKNDDSMERVERLVDIYESIDTSTHRQVCPSAQDRGANTEKHLPAVLRNPFKAAAVFLGLLCLLLLAGIIVLYQLYKAGLLRENQLAIKFEEEKKNISQDLNNYFCKMGEENQTEEQRTEWTRFRCHCYYTSTEMKNWTESREDCQRRGADLVMINSQDKQGIVGDLVRRGDSWIGLETLTTKDWKDEWKWVDGSQLAYSAWKVEVNTNTKVGAKAYVDLQGTWMHSINGSKFWICEKKMC